MSRLTAFQKRYIGRYWQVKTYSEISSVTGVDRSTIARYLRKKGIVLGEHNRIDKVKRINTGRTSSTPEIDRMLHKHYLAVPIKRLAEKVGKSSTFVSTRLRQLGLEIPREIIEQRKAESRIKKGNVPPNKGKKMPPDVYARCRKTMFKKGNKPPNTKYNGHERISKDGYVEVRVRLGKYVAKHRLVWKQHYGRIPKGHIVVFKDRNPLNVDISNLELLTREENMIRNSIHNYPDEIKTTIRNISKLKKKIEQHEKQDHRPEQPPVRATGAPERRTAERRQTGAGDRTRQSRGRHSAADSGGRQSNRGRRKTAGTHR